MDIMQEVTKSLTLIDELLLNLYQLNPGDENKLKKELPEEEFKKLNYVISTYNKLMDDDEYSLSEKGLIRFRIESQALLYYLREEYKIIQQEHSTAKEGNRLFSYKTHVLTWKTPVTGLIALFHTLALIIATLACLLSILTAYKLTDSNNLILVSSIIAFFLLWLSVPSAITEAYGKSPSKKFTTVATSLLLWKSLFKLSPYIIIGLALFKYNKYWKDDILIVLIIGLPICILLVLIKCNQWLTEANTLESEHSIEEPPL